MSKARAQITITSVFDGESPLSLSLRSGGDTLQHNTDAAVPLYAEGWRGGQKLTDAELLAEGSLRWYRDYAESPAAEGLSFTAKPSEASHVEVRLEQDGETLTGNPVSFSSPGGALRRLCLRLTPQQDLHGYSAPWPAGGGKNLLPDKTADNTTENGSSSVFDPDTGTYTVTQAEAYTGFVQTRVNFDLSAYAGKQVTFSCASFTGNTGPGDPRIYLYASGTSITSLTPATLRRTVTLPDDIGSCSILLRVSQSRSGDVGDSFTVSGLMLEEGGTATSYAPYANLCPIGGFTGAAVTRTGKNFLECNVSQVLSTSAGAELTPNGDGSFTVTSEDVTHAGTAMLAYNLAASNGGKAVSQNDQKKHLPNGTYRFVVEGTSAVALQVCAANSAGSAAADFSVLAAGTDIEFTITDEYAYNWVRLLAAKNRTLTKGTVIRPMIVRSSEEDPAFEPYVGTAYTVEFPAAAGTVYGGTLDLLAGTLTVLPAYASYAGQTLVGPWLSSMDAYAAGAAPTVGAQVLDLGGAPAVYSVAPPGLSAAAGENTLSADAGQLELIAVSRPLAWAEQGLASVYDGTPGEPGADGRTSYLHIKYSNDGGQSFTGNNGEDLGTWIGTCVDFEQADPTAVSAYTWKRFADDTELMTVITNKQEELRELLNSEYVAKSDFGTYREKASLEVAETAKQILESYDMLLSVEAGTAYQGGLRSAVEQLHGEIRRGWLTDPDTGLTVFGIAVAERLDFTGGTMETGGLTYYELAGDQTFGLYTAKGWQFWIDGHKTGWFDSEDKSLHVGKMTAEESLQLGGNWLISMAGGFGIRFLEGGN